MILPSKVLTYEESLLSKLPLLLRKIEETPISPYQLYLEVFKSRNNPFSELNQFVFALDTLFVLEKITYEDGVLNVC